MYEKFHLKLTYYITLKYNISIMLLLFDSIIKLLQMILLHDIIVK